MQSTNTIVSAAEELCRAAYDRLIAQGLSPEAAEAAVKRNFERLNDDANAVLNVEELCK